MKILILFAVTSLLMASCSKEENPVTNPEAMKGILFIESSPSGAEIWLQGVNTSQLTPDSLTDLTPGSYIVTLKFQSYNDTTFVVDIEEGKLTSVIVTLMSKPGGIYLSSSQPNAEIWLDGINTSQLTPDTLTNLNPGSYSITLKLHNYKDTTFVVSVNGGQITSMTVTLMFNLGSIYLQSSPELAEIWLNGINTSLTTPHYITSVEVGVYSITLKLTDYNDTTFSVSVTAAQITYVPNIVLISNIITTLYGPVKIYETAGTTANKPDGLDLSSGMTYALSSAQNNMVDIYYSTDGIGGQGLLILSADLHPSLIRETDFFIGSSGNLFDDEDSPLRNTGTWTNNINDRETNYVFLYDFDGHYSKLKIVNFGGGVPGEPAWVQVQWYYNETILDNRF
jgi:hypothetical protein